MLTVRGRGYQSLLPHFLQLSSTCQCHFPSTMHLIWWFYNTDSWIAGFWANCCFACLFIYFFFSFPDTEVRKVALSWVKNIGCDELVDYLPQLVQALKHETWEASPLAHFLLDRALSSPRVAHHLFWLLTQVLPGSSPQVCWFTFVRVWKLVYNILILLQNSLEGVPVDDTGVCQARYHRRLQLMLRALLAISGEAMNQRFMSQQLLVKVSRIHKVDWLWDSL
jgi:hypothetical protein